MKGEPKDPRPLQRLRSQRVTRGKLRQSIERQVGNYDPYAYRQQFVRLRLLGDCRVDE